MYYWRLNLAILAGAAVATAVLTGALLVGDSVRGSLRQLTLERLGGIDHALAAQRFFNERLVDRLSATQAFADGFELAAPAILLRGSAVHADTRARASEVGLQGIDERFIELYAQHGGDDATAQPTPETVVREALLAASAETMIFPPAVINESLARELGAAVGDDVIVSLKRWSSVPRGSLLGRKDTRSVVERVRCRVAAIIADQGFGTFGLAAHQTSPRNLFMPLSALQKALDQRGTVNAIVVQSTTLDAGAPEASALDEALRAVLEAADLGLTLEWREGVLSIESEELILKPTVARLAVEVADELGAERLPILTYLANEIRVGSQSVPYSTVSAISVPAPPGHGALRRVDGSAAPLLADDEILLNSWTAEELQAKPGDEVELTYFVVGPREDLREESHRFRLRGVVALEGLAADSRLAQDYPGIADVDNMADWDPPFPIDLGRIRPADEEYWDLHRSTPRAFVTLATGRELWRNRWGDLTAIRLVPPAGMAPEGLTEALRQRWLSESDLGAYGLAFQPVKARGLQAARGATDFAGLFIGFSQFLIISAALLAGLLFSLAVEQRASEIGLRLALGFPPRKIRRLLLGEGAVLAVCGALVGSVGAVAFAALMMAGLRTWWQQAVGTSRLFLHVEPLTLIAGCILSVAVVLFAVWRAVRRIGKVSASRLLARAVEPPETRPGRTARLTAALASGLATVLLLYAVVAGRTADPILFFALGPCLLIAALALLALRFGGGGSLIGRGPWVLWRMALSNCARNRGRSLLSAALVAVACFMIVAVAAFHQDFSAEASRQEGGTGGFALVAEADIALHQDLDEPADRFELGLSPELGAALETCSIVPLRLLPGDDTSCLNLYQPSRPRLLGVPPELVERQAFTFQSSITDTANPWTLLDQELEDGVIPVVGDMNSTQWILKLKLGEELTLENEYGETARLRLVGTLATSLFQSELLISEAQFLRHFPSHSGFSYFLIDAPSAMAPAVARLLENELEPYGFDALPAEEKLAAFHAVQNTYLSTFQSLGGLGLLLGTVGLAVILARNVLERRGELATLRAFGFRASTLTYIVVAENVFLLLAGLVIGSLAALVAVWPSLANRTEQVAWTSLGGSLAAIFIFGLVACTLTARWVLRSPLLPALKAE